VQRDRPLPPGAAASTPTHFRAPHDYGVAVILLGIADRMVPPEQVDASAARHRDYLTASQLTLVDDEGARGVRRVGADRRDVARAVEDVDDLVNTRDTKALGARLLPVLEHIDAYPDSLSPERSPLPKGPGTCSTARRTR
jgi:hypothetical protein